MEIVRTQWTGVRNIVLFNWHFFVIVVLLGIVLACLVLTLPAPWKTIAAVLLVLAFLSVVISIAASHLIYDRSNLYTLDWLDRSLLNSSGVIANFHSGFDETSVLIQKSFPDSKIELFDFFDPTAPSEVSIRRARKRYPPHPSTRVVSHRTISKDDNTFDLIFVILAAHEIRNQSERNEFFGELRRILNPGGTIAIVEHLRDPANFIAFSAGAFHFFSHSVWEETFHKGGLKISKEVKITPFLSAFYLHKDPLLSF